MPDYGRRFKEGDIVVCTQTPDKNAQFQVGMIAKLEKNPTHKGSGLTSPLRFEIFALPNGHPIPIKKYYAYWAEHEQCYELYDDVINGTGEEPVPVKPKPVTDKAKMARLLKDEINVLKNLRS